MTGVTNYYKLGGLKPHTYFLTALGSEVQISLAGLKSRYWYTHSPWSLRFSGGLEAHVLIFFCENSTITTCCSTTIDRRKLDPTKRYPTSKGKGEVPVNDRRGKITFGTKPHSHLGGSNKTLCAPGPRDPTKTEPDLRMSLLQRYESAVACWRGRGSGCSKPGSHRVWYKSLWRRSQLTPPKSQPADDPQTTDQLYQRNSHNVKVLGLTKDFQTWGPGKGNKNS